MYENLNLLAVNWSLGINVTICGLVIVFSMLILLVIILTVSGSIFGATSKNKPKAEQKAERKAAPVKSAVPVASVPVATNNDEIIAVIAAAVASMYEGTNIRPVIRAVKRSGSPTRPAWTAAGIYENTRSF